MIKCLIFDLDQTIIDTSSAAQYRTARNWPSVYATIPSFEIYNGISELFDYLTENEYKICIVTTSPSAYCERVLKHWKIPYHHRVCYHDVAKIKPHPESFLKALSLFNEEPKDVVSFGDRLIDIQASKAAGIPSVACLWGSAESKEMQAANPEYLAQTPSDALNLIKSLN